MGDIIRYLVSLEIDISFYMGQHVHQLFTQVLVYFGVLACELG
jgi:hypothetical protein